MAAYTPHVRRMTAGSTSERGAGIDDLGSILGDLSEKQLLELVREPGLLAALHLFLSGDRFLAALNVLDTMTATMRDQYSPMLEMCRTAIFDSPCS